MLPSDALHVPKMTVMKSFKEEVDNTLHGAELRKKSSEISSIKPSKSQTQIGVFDLDANAQNQFEEEKERIKRPTFIEVFPVDPRVEICQNNFEDSESSIKTIPKEEEKKEEEE